VPLHVVVGIIINPLNQILIAQRLAHQEAAGVWEFPGGKVEADESAYHALLRELKEEIGIDVTSAEKWLEISYQYPQKLVLLDTWMVKAFAGEPIGAEGQPIRWVAINELESYTFPGGNKKIIEKLLLL